MDSSFEHGRLRLSSSLPLELEQKANDAPRILPPALSVRMCASDM